MNQFFWSKNYLSYIRQKKIIAKHIYPKYLIRNIEINNLKLLYIDDYSTIDIKFLNTEYSLLWTQKLMNIGNTYLGYHKTYKFYFDDLDPTIYIHWRKLNFNYASRLLKQSYFFITTKKESFNNCLILRVKKGGFWCITQNILFFIRKNNIKRFTKKYLFNNNFILLKNYIKDTICLKKFSFNIYNYISNLLKLHEHKKLFLMLYKTSSLKFNNFFIFQKILSHLLNISKYKSFLFYLKIIKVNILRNLMNNMYIF